MTKVLKLNRRQVYAILLLKKSSNYYLNITEIEENQMVALSTCIVDKLENIVIWQSRKMDSARISLRL
jgi:hypothetical protein